MLFQKFFFSSLTRRVTPVANTVSTQEQPDARSTKSRLKKAGDKTWIVDCEGED